MVDIKTPFVKLQVHLKNLVENFYINCPFNLIFKVIVDILWHLTLLYDLFEAWH